MTNQTTTAELPNWEALYEPGNVSTYLIGYANDQDAATGMAEAWMRSQAEVTGRLEWVDDERLATGRYDRWFELIECHGDAVDTGTGIVVRRRVADEPAPAAVSAAVAPPTNDTHGLSVQHADALYDAIATPGPARESFDDQHARVCAVVRQILDDLLPEPAEETTTQTTAEAALAAVEAALCDTLLPDAREEALDRLMTVLPPTTDRAVLREAADRIDNEELPHDYVDMFDNGARWAAKLLRRMADETATETPTVTVHAAPDLSPTAEEALGALIDVAKQQAVCDFEHPHPEHPCGRRTAAGARQDGAET